MTAFKSSVFSYTRILFSRQMKRIGTHDGTFHCDEALGIFLLKQLDEFSDAEVIRSRDPELWKTCDALVDVGGVYDVDKLRFDHHQKGFFETFNAQRKIKLSSAGLVYKHFGQRIIAKELNKPLIDEQVTLLYNKLYEDFVEALDGIDNGIPKYPNDITPAYRDSTGLTYRVSNLNPWWNQSNEDLYERFQKAIKLAGTEFMDLLRYYAFSWLPAREIIETAVLSRHEVDKSGKIITLLQHCPWKEHLFDIEKKEKIEGEILYALYPDNSKGWRIQSVAVASDSFISRKALPEPWRGLRDQLLNKETGIEDCVFVHNSGFIGGNQTKEGALAMARAAILL